MSGKTETEVRCQLCGTRRYGAEADRLVEQALSRVTAHEESERRFREQAEDALRARNAAEREAELARVREETRRSARERQELLDQRALRLAQEAELERLELERVELERVELERVELERVAAARKAVLDAEREAQRERDRATSAKLDEKRRAVDAMVARRLGLNEAARQARLDAPRLRRERLADARAASIALNGTDALCASPLCANPHPPDRRYCCKGCSDHVAREKYVAKRNAA
jgi:hypothetical protein